MTINMEKFSVQTVSHKGRNTTYWNLQCSATVTFGNNKNL